MPPEASVGIPLWLSPRKGAHIIAVAKTVGALEELDDEIQALGGSATLVPLDLTDYEGIDRLGGAIYERWGKLDILFGNAGLLGAVTPITHLDPVKDWEKVMSVNLTANWRLIRSLDPLLRLSDVVDRARPVRHLRLTA